MSHASEILTAHVAALDIADRILSRGNRGKTDPSDCDEARLRASARYLLSEIGGINEDNTIVKTCG